MASLETLRLFQERASREREKKFLSEPAPALTTTAPEPAPVPVSAPAPVPDKSIMEIPSVPRAGHCPERYAQVQLLMKPFFCKKTNNMFREMYFQELVRHANLFLHSTNITVQDMTDYFNYLKENVNPTRNDSFVHYGLYMKEKKRVENIRRDKIHYIFTKTLSMDVMPDDIRNKYMEEMEKFVLDPSISLEIIAVYTAFLESEILPFISKFMSFEQFINSQKDEKEKEEKKTAGLDEYKKEQEKKYLSSRPEGFVIPNRDRQDRIVKLFEKSIEKFGKQAVEELRWFQRPEMESIPMDMIVEYTKSLEDSKRNEREFWNYLDFKRDFETRKKREEDKIRLEEKTRELLKKRSEEIRQGDRYIPKKTTTLPKSKWPKERKEMYKVKITGCDSACLKNLKRSQYKYENIDRPSGYRLDGKRTSSSHAPLYRDDKEESEEIDSDSDSDSSRD